MTRFVADHGQVFFGTARLSPESVEELLSLFLREGAREAYFELADADLEAGGIERVSGLRRVA